MFYVFYNNVLRINLQSETPENINISCIKEIKMIPVLTRTSVPKLSNSSKVLRRFSSALPNTDNDSNRLKAEKLTKNISQYRFVYPEFLPDPKIEFRNQIREKLERNDMIARRTQIDIPEFYVGSILAVSSSDKHNPGRAHRFVGICIHRAGCGLRANFILRNVIDQQGVEIMYQIYDPSLQKVEVLRLEKRLDDELLYLRDALPEYSTFDVNMEPEIIAEGSPVPINPIKVKLRPRPWLDRWERKNLQGVQDLELPEKFYKRAAEVAKPWEKYDLMKEYMRTIPEEEQIEILNEVQTKLQTMDIDRKKTKRKRVFVKPTKLA